MVPVAAGDGAGLGGVTDAEPRTGAGDGAGGAFGVCVRHVGAGGVGMSYLKLDQKSPIWSATSPARTAIRLLRRSNSSSRPFGISAPATCFERKLVHVAS